MTYIHTYRQTDRQTYRGDLIGPFPFGRSKITTMEDTGGGQITTATAVENKHTLGKNAQQKTIRVIFAIYRATGPECATKENKEGKIGGITKIETPITEIVKMTIRE